MRKSFSTVTALPIAIVLRAAASAGVDTDAVLEEASVDPERLAGLRARLPYNDVAAITAALERRAIGVPLALHAIDELDSSALRLVEHLARTCGTLRTAVRLTIGLQRLIGDGIGFELRDDGREATFIHVDHPGHPIPAVLAELTLVAIAECGRRLTGRELRVSRVDLPHARPAHASRLEAYFGAPATFGTSEIAIRFPAIYLDLPMRGDAGELDALETSGRAIIEALPEDEGLLSELRAWMAAHLANEPALVEAAGALGVSSRTLQRHLQACGTSFQAELDAVRREIARGRALVEPSIAALATSLGFRDVSAFARAFRRWMGESPREFRARQRDVRMGSSTIG